jgi:hypothetical protein
MPLTGRALVERQRGTVAHFRLRQRQTAAVGGARYAIRYLIAFGRLRGLPGRPRPWQPGKRDERGRGNVG